MKGLGPCGRITPRLVIFPVKHRVVYRARRPKLGAQEATSFVPQPSSMFDLSSWMARSIQGHAGATPQKGTAGSITKRINRSVERI